MSDPNVSPPARSATPDTTLATVQALLEAGASVQAARVLLESVASGQPSVALRLGARGQWPDVLHVLEQVADVHADDLDNLADVILPPDWIGHEELRFELLYSLSLAYTRTADYARANDVIETAQALASAINNSAAQGRALGRMASNLMLMGEMQQSARLYERAIAIARTSTDRIREASWLGEAGIVYAILGQTRRATTYFTEAADIAMQTGDPLEEARWRGNVGWAMLDCGDYTAAHGHIRYALDYATAHNDQLSAIQQQINLGRLYINQKEPHTAITYLTAALALAKASVSLLGQAEAWTLLTDAYLMIGNIPAAMEAVSHALDFARLSESPDQLTAAYIVQGVLSLAQNSLNAAQEAFEQAGFLSAEMHALYLNARALCGTGDVAQARNDIAGAFRAWFAAWSVCNQTDCMYNAALHARLVALHGSIDAINFAALLQTIADSTVRAAFLDFCTVSPT